MSTVDRKSATPPSGSDTRRRVIETAERLLAGGDAGFSMRELAAEAGVSFATPFNQFGSKGGLMLALSAQRIERMVDRVSAAPPPPSAPAGVLAAMDVAAAVMLETPAVSRAVMGALGTPSEETGDVSARSRGLWVAALGRGEGLDPTTGALALAALPDQLAVAFRGVLSFWSAGEIPDGALTLRAKQAAAMLLLGLVRPDDRPALIHILQAHP